MKKIDKLALDEIKNKAGTIRHNLYDAKANLLSIKQTLMHCDPNLSKEAVVELITAAQKALASVDTSSEASDMISKWADGLLES